MGEKSYPTVLRGCQYLPLQKSRCWSDMSLFGEEAQIIRKWYLCAFINFLFYGLSCSQHLTFPFQESMKWFINKDWCWNGLHQPYRIMERNQDPVHIKPHLAVSTVNMRLWNKSVPVKIVSKEFKYVILCMVLLAIEPASVVEIHLNEYTKFKTLNIGIIHVNDRATKRVLYIDILLQSIFNAHITINRFNYHCLKPFTMEYRDNTTLFCEILSYTSLNKLL